MCPSITITENFTGEWTAYFNDGVKSVTLTGEDVVTFTCAEACETLQQGYTYVVEIYNAAGVQYTETIDAVEYDCWKFTIKEVAI